MSLKDGVDVSDVDYLFTRRLVYFYEATNCCSRTRVYLCPKSQQPINNDQLMTINDENIFMLMKEV